MIFTHSKVLAHGVLYGHRGRVTLPYAGCLAPLERIFTIIAQKKAAVFKPPPGLVVQEIFGIFAQYLDHDEEHDCCYLREDAFTDSEPDSLPPFWKRGGP